MLVGKLHDIKSMRWLTRCEHFQLSSLGQSIICDNLSDYCSTAEVMMKIHNWLYAKLAARLCLDWISGNLGDEREEISKLCIQQQ